MNIYLATNQNKEYYFDSRVENFKQREVKPFNKNLVFLSLIPIPFIESFKERYIDGSIMLYSVVSVVIGLFMGYFLSKYYKQKIFLNYGKLN